MLISGIQRVLRKVFISTRFNTLRPEPNGRYFIDIFKYIFLNENLLKPNLKRILIWISLKYLF